MYRASGVAGVPAGRLVFVFVFSMLVTFTSSDATDECYCDGWYSTNTRTMDFPTTNFGDRLIPGMSYVGGRSTTFNGREGLAWKDVFETCTVGYKEDELEARLEDMRYELKVQGSASIALSHLFSYMIPDRFRLRDLGPNPGVFENAANSSVGHNQCRSAVEGGFINLELATTSGPFCFVDATDQRAVNFTRERGWISNGTAGDAIRANCPQITAVPCGISRCEPDVTSEAEVGCARSATNGESASPAQLLMTNGGMELWERRSNRNGIMRNARIVQNPPDWWADVTYQAYPDYEDLLASYPPGANPAEPRFWDLCLYTPDDVQNMGLGFNATTDSADDTRALLHRTGALTRCDPVHPRAQGISLSQVSPGRKRATGTSVARMAFVKVNDTASLKAESGAMASMVPGGLHIARAWVRCAKGSSTVALVVSKLPHDAPVAAQDIQVTMRHYDAMTNVSVEGEPTANTVRCDVDPTSYTSSSDAPESASGWVQLEVAVSSSEAEHDITVQVIVQSHSDDAAVLMDDVSWELATSASPRVAVDSDSSSSASVFATTCAGGGGGGVSYTDAHKCSTDPTRLFYRLREIGGVPMAYEQVHAMVVIGYKSVRCRRPELDATSQLECPFLSEASLPHLSADDVRAYMDTLTDAEVEAAMRWNDVSSRGPGVRTSVAIEILRAGLPDAIEKGAVRVLHGPAFNMPTNLGNYIPSLGPLTASDLTWFAMASTTSWKTYDLLTSKWHLCEENERRRGAICDILSLTTHLMGCHVLPTVMQIPIWEELVAFEGQYNTRGEPAVGAILGAFDETATVDLSAGLGFSRVSHYTARPFTLNVLNPLLDTYLTSVRKHMGSQLVDGEYLCSSSFRHFFDLLDTVPSEVSSAASGNNQPVFTDNCMHPHSLLETTLTLLLPKAAPVGSACKVFDTTDYESTIWVDGRHAVESDDKGGGGRVGW